MLVDQQTADQYCEALANRHYMKVSEEHYDSIPVEARGIPHLAIPGLHAYLDEYYQGLKTLRSKTHPERVAHNEFPTTQSMSCLPFTPFGQALAPGTTAELDTTHHFAFRNRADQCDMDGRCFLNDATLEDVALLRAPLFPRAQIVDAADNPFELADDHIDSFFNMAATVAILLQTEYGVVDKDLVEQVALSFHGKRPVCEGMQVAADLMVLFNGMYPMAFGVSKPHILSAYAEAVAKAHRAAKEQEAAGATVQGLSLNSMNLPPEDVTEAQSYGQRFFTLVFPELWPLVQLLSVMQGRYNMRVEETHEMSKRLERAVRAAWYLHSPDGELPPPLGHPLAGVAGPDQVNCKHVAPRVVDREQGDDTWEKARGGLVGMMPGGYRQLLSMLVAASTMDVAVQVHRNYGGLLLRPSAAPDIMTKEGKPRSEKAISPLGVEGDQWAWGTRAGKLRNCRRQRKAWKSNLLAILPLCVTVSKPLPPDERLQCDDSCVEFVRSRAAAHGQTGTKTAEELEALAAFNAAVAPATEAVSGR